MPTPTYDLIDSTVLSSSASSVTFSSIPATYRDLVLVATPIISDLENVNVRVNSDTGSNYSYVSMAGNGSTTSSGASSASAFLFDPLIYNTSNTNEPFIIIAQFQDYSATDKHKTLLGRVNSASRKVAASAQRWANTSAINTILVYHTGAGNLFASGSTFYLYGIVS